MLCCRPCARVRLAQSCHPREGGDLYAVSPRKTAEYGCLGLADARPGRQDKQSGNDSGERYSAHSRPRLRGDERRIANLAPRSQV